MSKRYPWIESHLPTLARWRRGQRAPSLLKSFLLALLQLAWVSLLVWFLWNDAISDFFGAGRIDVWKAVGLGVLVAIVASVFRDAPPRVASPAQARRP
jgi:hypothetical protein